MQVGMIGLGRMGANMVRRLIRKGHSCVVFNRSPMEVLLPLGYCCITFNEAGFTPMPSGSIPLNWSGVTCTTWPAVLWNCTIPCFKVSVGTVRFTIEELASRRPS